MILFSEPFELHNLIFQIKTLHYMVEQCVNLSLKL